MEVGDKLKEVEIYTLKEERIQTEKEKELSREAASLGHDVDLIIGNKQEFSKKELKMK